jgi:hypothetical protein
MPKEIIIIIITIIRIKFSQLGSWNLKRYFVVPQNKKGKKQHWKNYTTKDIIHSPAFPISL